MKKVLRFVATIALLSLTIPSFVKAQSAYVVQPIPYTPYSYTGENDVPLNSIDDINSGVIDIGFTFKFFGNDYTQLLASTNGYLTFDLSQANGYSQWPISAPIPSAADPVNAVMGPWQDLYPGASMTLAGILGYATYGVAPNRTFVMSYFNNPLFSCTDSSFTGQIVLHETTNAIDVFIGHKSLCQSWNGGQAIEGIQNADGTVAYTVPGRNANTMWTAYNEGWRFAYCAPSAPTDTVSGYVFLDNNHNCTYDAGDQPIAQEMVIADTCAIAYTDAAGHYSLLLDAGTHTLTHSVAAYASAECPVGNSQVVTFAAPNESSVVDFADSLSSTVCNDVSGTLGAGCLRPCVQNLYSVYYCNNGLTATPPMLLDVTVADSNVIVGSSVPALAVSGNTYTFQLPYLMPGMCGWFHLIDSLSCDVALGTVKCMSSNIYGYNDCDTTDNASTDCQEVVGSYDPNEMLVASQNFTQRGYIHGETIQSDDYLSFQINFQNTGSAPAIDVTVVDTLPSSLDASTVVAGMSSHPYSLTNDNGILTWTFANVMLPDSNANEVESHGFLRFTVQQNPNNLPGQLIPNRASIYFDQNDPVLTNRAVDTLQLDINVDEIEAGELAVYPNPAHDAVRVQYNGNEKQVELDVLNVLGETLTTATLPVSGLTLKTTDWVKGFYMLRLRSNDRIVATRALTVE